MHQAKKILEIISKNGGEARFVGGAVRDFILGLEVKEIDIACNLKPEKTTEIFDNLGIKTIPTGIDFGTITILFEGIPYEITTLRSDVSCDGRHAEVQFSQSFEEDSNRRDFTFNALYMDIDGKIYDFHNGIEDLKNGVVRFIGNADERIKEDYLRILRFFRFYAYFGDNEILQSELQACINNKEGLKIISGERIKNEFCKLLLAPKAKETLEILYRNNFLEIISDIKNEDFEIANFENKIIHNPILALAIILKFSENTIKKIATKWHISKKERKLLTSLSQSLQADFEDKYQVNNLIRTKGKDEFFDCLVLNKFKKRINEKQYINLSEYAQNLVIPEFPLKASDLMAMGVPQGKKLGELLSEAEKIWEKSEYKTSKQKLLSIVNSLSFSDSNA
jgi:poly(A) polymerase